MSQTGQHVTLTTRGLIIWALAAGFFLYEFFLRTLIGSVAQQLMPDLQLNPASLAIIGSAYYISYGIMQIPVGILTDKFGARILMVSASLICAVSTLIFAQATGFSTAFISRLLMGFGSSFAFICLLAIVASWLPQQYFGFFIGVSQFIGTMGPFLASGPLVGLMQHSQQGWRSTFSEAGVTGIVLAIVIAIFVRNKPQHGKRVLIFLIPNEEPISSRLNKLIRNRQAWAIAFYSGCIYVSIVIIGELWGVSFLQAQGLSQLMSANIVSLAWLGYACGCPLLGALSDIAKRRKPTLLFCALLGLVITLVITYVPLQQDVWHYAILFFGLGFAAAGQNIGFATIAEHSDLSTRASSLGLNNAFITLFAAFIPPIASYFIDIAAGLNHSTALQPAHFTTGFSMMPLMFVTALMIAYLCIDETYCKPQKQAIMLQVDYIS